MSMYNKHCYDHIYNFRGEKNKTILAGFQSHSFKVLHKSLPGSDPTLSEPFSDDKSKLKRLWGIEPGVTVCVVTRAQIIKCDSPWPTDALSHVLTSHLQMNPTRVASFLLVHVEECSHLSLSNEAGKRQKLRGIYNQISVLLWTKLS